MAGDPRGKINALLANAFQPAFGAGARKSFRGGGPPERGPAASFRRASLRASTNRDRDPAGTEMARRGDARAARDEVLVQERGFGAAGPGTPAMARSPMASAEELAARFWADMGVLAAGGRLF